MGAKKLLRRIFKIKNKKEPREHYWESYNRSFFIANKIKSLGLENCRLLDVGGEKLDNLFEKFGIKNITTVNILEDADIVASAHKLPISDGSFEYVTCVDTLEHISKELRGQVVGELVRVARKAVFIAAPVDSEENNRAEKFVLQYLPAAFVKEHRIFGLVDFNQIKSELEAMKKLGRIEDIEEDSLDNLMSWVILMIGDKVEPSKLYKELYFLENGLHPRRKALSIHLK
ncbi:MAG: class I SAM-dependent methyltransferase [Candidatus Omnitrophota bacterium]|nr:class I SAM-dependent methyltransferase [Candidatus Omnitrophota bacterium]